jgi:hypothetical protein
MDEGPAHQPTDAADSRFFAEVVGQHLRFKFGPLGIHIFGALDIVNFVLDTSRHGFIGFMRKKGC